MGRSTAGRCGVVGKHLKPGRLRLRAERRGEERRGEERRGEESGTLGRSAWSAAPFDIDAAMAVCKNVTAMAQELIHQVIVRARQLIDDEAG